MKQFCHSLIALSCFLYSSISLSVPERVLLEGWHPASVILAEGNNSLAIERLREYTEIQKTLFENIDLHPQTKKFLDQVWDSLESFNLDQFHRNLPEETENGRLLRVYGGLVDNRYPIGPNPIAGMNSSGEPTVMGNFSATIASQRTPNIDETQYLLEAGVQVGVGKIEWTSIQQALTEILAMSTGQNPELQGDPNAPWQQPFRAKVKLLNPKLDDEDVDILAPIWASYPALAELIARFGEIEDIIYFDTGLPYRRFSGSFRLLPERMKKHYPHLANHLDDFHRLLRGSIRLHDKRGDLLSANINSKTLRGQINMYVANGRILPVKHNKVILDAPAIPDNKPWEIFAQLEATVSVLGINIHLQNTSARIHTLSTSEEFKLVGQITQVPTIRIDGNALGIFPTWMAEIPLPATFHEIITEFLTAACQGNDGNGVLAGIHFKPASSGETSNLIAKVEFEGLQNFFVRFGMSIVNDRIIPDNRAQNELDDLFYDVQTAFASDLKGFESAVAKQLNKENVSIPTL